jgi:hypothetical protein
LPSSKIRAPSLPVATPGGGGGGDLPPSKFRSPSQLQQPNGNPCMKGEENKEEKEEEEKDEEKKEE